MGIVVRGMFPSKLKDIMPAALRELAFVEVKLSGRVNCLNVILVIL